MSKKLFVNCGMAVMLKDDATMFEGYDRGMINAGKVIINSKLQSKLSKMNYNINSGNISTLDIEGNIFNLGDKENININDTMNFENCFVIAKGIMIIESSGIKALEKATGIYAKAVYYPESLNLSSICKIYSDCKSYPDGYKLILEEFILDENSAINIKENENIFVANKMIALDEDVLKTLGEKNVKLKCQSLLTTEGLFKKYENIIKCDSYVLLPGNHKIVGEDIILDEFISAIYGNDIYIKGDMILRPKDVDCLNEFNSIIVEGCAKIPFSSIKTFNKVGKAKKILPYKGELLDIDGVDVISHEMLKAAKDAGISYTILLDGKLKINEDVTVEDLSCIEAIYYDGVIEVSDSLKPALMKTIRDGDGIIKNFHDDIVNKYISQEPDEECVKINTGIFIL